MLESSSGQAVSLACAREAFVFQSDFKKNPAMSDVQSLPLPSKPAKPLGNTAANAKRGFLRTGVQAVLVLCVIMGCLAMLESGLRLTGRYKMSGIEGYLAPGGISFGLKKNASKTVYWRTRSFAVHISDLGFRAPKTGPHLTGKPYYAVLGASDVFGNGLDYEQTFVGVLAEKLAPHQVEVLNIGIGGHHLLEQSAMFEQYTKSATQAPAMVIIVLQPLFIGGYDDIHQGTTVRRGELFPEKNWRLPLAKMILANSSASFCFFRDAIRNIQARYSSRGDTSVSFYVQRYSTKHPIRSPEKSGDFLEKLEDLEAYIRSLGAVPVCVYCPPAGGFQLNDLVAKGELASDLVDSRFFADLVRMHCESKGVKFINVEPLLQQRYDRGEQLNLDGDGHFNEPTSRLVGEYLYEQLKPDRQLPGK